MNWDSVGLGDRPDTEIAAELGCSVGTVGHHRRKRNKPHYGHILGKDPGMSRVPKDQRPPPLPVCDTCGGKGHTAESCSSAPWDLDPSWPWVLVASMKKGVANKVSYLRGYDGIRTYPKDAIDARCYLGGPMPPYFPTLGKAMLWMMKHPGRVAQVDVRTAHDHDTGLHPNMLDWDEGRPFPGPWAPTESFDHWRPPPDDLPVQAELPFD